MALTSAASPEHRAEAVDVVLLALTVEGTTEAVAAAVQRIRAGLPPGASIAVDERGSDRV